MSRVRRIVESLRKVFMLVFPLSTATSIDQFIDIAVLLPDFRKLRHVIRVVHLFTVYALFFFTFLNLRYLKPYLLQPNSSNSRVERCVFAAAGILVLEFFYTRVWLLMMQLTDRIDFFDLAKQLKPSSMKVIMKYTRALCVFTSFSGIGILLFLVLMQIYGQETLGSRVLLLFWMIYLISFIRFNAADMFIIYAIVAAGLLVMRERTERFKAALLLLLCYENRKNLMNEAAHVKRSLDTLKEVIESLNAVNPLVKCLMMSNRLVVTPTASLFLFLVAVEEDNIIAAAVQALITVFFATYIARTYVVTYLFATVHTESLAIRTKLISTMAHSSHLSVEHRVMLNHLVSAIDEKQNFLALRDVPGVISRLDIISSLSVTLQFVILLFNLEMRGEF